MQPPHRDQIVGILLAAGRGVRFDPSGAQNKLMQTTATGRKVVAAAAAALLAALPAVTAVVRRADDAAAAAAAAVVAELSGLGCNVVVCADADQGMGASLVCALEHNRDAAGWVIGLGDMPCVQTTTIAALADALEQGADIVVPVCKGRRGNPVGFGKKHLAELLRLGGDQGARMLLKMHPVTMVEVDDPGIHFDIDTAADLLASADERA